jgi:hypothetical protein
MGGYILLIFARFFVLVNLFGLYILRTHFPLRMYTHTHIHTHMKLDSIKSLIVSKRKPIADTERWLFLAEAFTRKHT